MNPEVIAWLDLYGTGIDYPVTQGKDNMKYVNTNAAGSYSLAGSLFLDSGADASFADFASVIYGHHMEGKALFGGLSLFAGRDYFEDHTYGRLYAAGRWYGLEAVAFVRADAYDGEVYRAGITAPEDRRSYLEALSARALNVRDESGLEEGCAGEPAGERLVLLSTCSPGATNARDILVCRLTDKVVPDPFAGATAAATGAGAATAVAAQSIADGPNTLTAISEAWRELPLWIKAANVGALAALVAVVLWACLRRRRRFKDTAVAGMAHGETADDDATDDAAYRPRWAWIDAGDESSEE
jgi:SrtB family sortase